jgi:hypothetical protein
MTSKYLDFLNYSESLNYLGKRLTEKRFLKYVLLKIPWIKKGFIITEIIWINSIINIISNLYVCN